MALLSTTDLEGMLVAIGGVPIAAGAISGTGVYRKNHQMIFNEEVIILEHSVRTRTDQFGHLGYGSYLAVFDANGSNGVSFKVTKEPMQINRGQVCIIELIKVAAAVAPRLSRLLRTGSGLTLRTGAGRALQTQPY